MLDQNIDNFHNESEQIAFSPGLAPPGTGVMGSTACVRSIRLQSLYTLCTPVSLAASGPLERQRLIHCCVFAGITYSDDKLLQTRVNAYADTQRYRLGVKCELAAACMALHIACRFVPLFWLSWC